MPDPTAVSTTLSRSPGAHDPDAPRGASVQSTLDRYWSSRARHYHSAQTGSERAAAEAPVWRNIWASALPSPPAPVLDVGTGTGHVARCLAECGFTVTGIDTAAGMLQEARRSVDRWDTTAAPAPTFRHGDAVAPVGVGSGYRAITSRYLLWTLRDPVTALRAWSELLLPGGTIACVDANWYPQGIAADIEVESDDGADAFVATYDSATWSHLPLAGAASHDEYAAVFERAGLYDIRVDVLSEIQELDRRFGVSPGHESRPVFMVTGRTAD